VAYYPSKYPLQYRAQYLGDRDLFGELVKAAHEDGLVVLARMDSNRTHQEFYRAHSDWFARDINGQPYRAADRYITCIHSPYYDEYIPNILREVIGREKPVGITDNSWSGLDRNRICYCKYCVEKFHAASGKDLPKAKDWDSAVYRQWIKWNYARRVEVWDLNNRTTKAAGGPHCLWLGMVGGDPISQGGRFRDMKEILGRAEMIMLDDQGRSDSIGFQENAEMGKRLHGLLGWDKVIPESMAMYQRAPTFRKAVASKAEARMWMVSGFAGTIQPWWHHVGAYQWDRRQFRTAEPVYRWYEANQAYLVKRRPVATVGVVWSQENADFYGRDEAHELVALPYYGVIQALVRARIPYLPVHADHIDPDGSGLSLLILPNLAVMTKTQIVSVRRFVERGGGLLATGEASLYEEWGDKRSDFALADLFGARFTGRRHGSTGEAQTGQGSDHTYLRLHPEAGADVYGPKSGSEPPVSGKRHPALRGFEDTDILPFGGFLQEVKTDGKTVVPITLIPHFPVYPPETSWMRQPRTNIPALVLNAPGTGGRRAYLAADIDRRFARDNLPDHGDLLANLVRWAAGENIPLAVEGPGLIDCHLYHQPGRLILHLVNLTSAGTWRSPVHDLIPVGPLRVKVKLSEDVSAKSLKFLVSGEEKSLTVKEGWGIFELKSVLDHEVAVIG
ncbi:Tat pathway signal protein, partial [Acidobacteria bacterium AH-259-L09]|nr:Tat pathway signal protein [Acidobacteria bacterium AH-259-L09]